MPRVDVDWRDEDFPVALGSWRDGNLQEQGLEHQQDFIQRHWPHGAHRRQLRQHRQNSVGVFERSSCERAQLVEPLAPVRRLGQAVEQIDERDCVCRERSEVLKRSRQDRRLRFVFLSKLRKPQPEIVDKPVDSTPPPIAPADHRRVDEETLPTTRRPQLSFP